MECLTVQSGWNFAALKSKAESKISFASFFSPLISKFGNSHKCAFTIPTGRCWTRNFPLRSMTKAKNVSRCRCCAFAEVWQFFHAVFLERDAKFFYRTNQALRISRRANQRAKFHQRLIEMRTGICVARRILFLRRLRVLRATNQFFRQLPKPCIGFLFLWIFADAKNARQHADDIAIKNRRRLIEGDAANRAGGVAADSRQCQNVVKVFQEICRRAFPR